MTLVLGAIAVDAVVLGADSRTEVWVITGDAVRSGGTLCDRKLFKVERVGIATYGAGPAGVRVPDVLASELQPGWGVADAVNYLQPRCASVGDSMGALVGGLDDRGDALLVDLHMDGSAPRPIASAIGVPGAVVLRGVENSQRHQREPYTAAAIMAQMFELLLAAAGNPAVGPPYEFLVIPRPAIALGPS